MFKADKLDSHIQRRKHSKEGDEPIFSIHKRNKDRTLWYGSSWETMESSSVPTNLEKVTYKSKIYPWHGLHRGLLTTQLPEIRAKEGYTFKWCDNLFVNMVKSFKIVFNETELQNVNTKYIFSRLNDIHLNQVASEWTSHSPSTGISMRPPFFYDRHNTDSFPLALCGQSDQLLHVFDFKLNLSELIVVRDHDNMIVDYDPEFFEITNNATHVPVPELEGLYTKHADDKTDFGSNEFFVRDCYYVEHDNEVPLGKRVQLKLDSSLEHPIEDIAWAAVNVSLSESSKTLVLTKNDTTTPIKSTSLHTSTDPVMEDKPSFKTEYAYLRDTKDYIPGLNRWSNSICDTDQEKFLPGVDFRGGKIVVNTGVDSNNGTYMVFALLSYTKYFVFKTYPKTQSERLVQGSTIELKTES
jgi:hypothetical protein